MSEADLIQGSSVKCRTMADGTFRLEIDIEPSQAMQAFGLFGQPGAPVVLARLTQAAAQASMQKKVAEPEQKGGDLARMAGVFCKEPMFWLWLATDRGVIVNPDDKESDAREYILKHCNIESRRELDHDWKAGQLFHDRIRKPFIEWRRSK